MNILYVLNSSNPGGMEQHVLDLVKGMVGQGFKVFVWCGDGEIAQWYSDAGAEVTIRQINFDVDPLYIYKLIKFIRSNHIDIIHGHELKAAVNSALAGKISGVPGIVTIVHTPISEWKIDNPVKKALLTLEQIFYSLLVNSVVDAEIALTPSRKRVKLSEGISEKKLVIIPNAVDTQKFVLSDEIKQRKREAIRSMFGISETAQVFGMVGRMTTEKGHRILIEAFAKYLSNTKTDNTSVLLLAGGGKLEKELKNLTKILNIEDRVFFTGIFRQDLLVDYYAAFDYFIFPSLAEGFGLVFVEAMASGLPIISADLPVLREIGTDEVLYFTPGNSDSLAHAIEKCVRLDQVSLKNYSAELRKHAIANFDLKNFVNNYIKLYESIIAR